MRRRRISTAHAAAWLGLWLVAPAPARAEPPPNLAPERVAPDFFASGALPPLDALPGDRLRHRAPGFTATIHPDGRVEFRDVVERDLKLQGYDLRRRRLEAAPLDQRAPQWVDFQERATFPMGRLPVFLNLGGRFGGLADWTLGQKHVSAKRAFLEATAGLRMRLAYGWQRARLREQLAALGDRLVAIWRDGTTPLAERKRLLFALWDESAERDLASTSPFDALRGAAGEAARRKIAAFVRLVAPPGSPDAFTADELARLNRGRRGGARFEPYRDVVAASPELPDLPAEPLAATEPDVDAASDAYGPAPEPSVVVPALPREAVQPVPKRRSNEARPSVQFGGVQLHGGPRTGR